MSAHAADSFGERRPLRRRLLGAVAVSLAVQTVYLIWIWPRPSGTSFLAEVAPYFLSLLAGLPFLGPLARGPRGLLVVSAFLVLGFAFLWIYSLGVLCGVRGVCL